MAKSKAKIAFVAPQLDDDGQWVFFVREPDGTERKATSNEISQIDQEFRVEMERKSNNFQKMQEQILADPNWRPPLNARYLQYALWAEGRDTTYAPTIADAFLNAVEHQKKVYGTNGELKTTKVTSQKKAKPRIPEKRFIARKIYSCPNCKGKNIYTNGVKGKKWRSIKCRDCGKTFQKRVE